MPASLGARAADAVRDAVRATCRRARDAGRTLATASGASKTAALLAAADALEASSDRILAAIAEDLDRGRREGLAEGLLDELRLGVGPQVGTPGRRLFDGLAPRRMSLASAASTPHGNLLLTYLLD